MRSRSNVRPIRPSAVVDVPEYPPKDLDDEEDVGNPYDAVDDAPTSASPSVPSTPAPSVPAVAPLPATGAKVTFRGSQIVTIGILGAVAYAAYQAGKGEYKRALAVGGGALTAYVLRAQVERLLMQYAKNVGLVK